MCVTSIQIDHLIGRNENDRRWIGSFKQHGGAITKEQLEQLLTMEPRRHRLVDPAWHNTVWSALRAPIDEGQDWCLSFPFFESFGPAFDEFCQSKAVAGPIEKLPSSANETRRKSLIPT